ncbi:unnamed protein product [Clonostachys rosea f. rosea IK726]|uniref:Uncharacterized protein n=2 Tax=Clonostachys rosea f. rosea IK726 TaxID=1349383 RepID=A0ACA9U812_BIOOC|nr:unnamed protein product [Clonostachys rosea f. rosea IK726]CAG9949451.1 unnamed protein product [Clonostachys rosea f. rosea IK726]
MAKKQKRGGASTPRGGRGGRAGIRTGGRFAPQITNTPPNGSYMSLAEEARQTSRQNHSFWEQGSSLRSRPVKFVSAGTSEPLKQLDEEIIKADDAQLVRSLHEEATPQVPDATIPSVHVSDPALDDESKTAPASPAELPRDEPDKSLGDESSADSIIGPEELEQGLQSDEPAEAEPASYCIDLKGDTEKSIGPKLPLVLPEHPELDKDTSSEDEILLFKGRDKPRVPPQPTTISVTQMQTEIRVVEEQLEASSQRQGSTEAPKKTSRERRRNQRQQKHRHNNDEDELIADYVANMRENGEMPGILLPTSLSRRDLGGSPSPIISDATDNEDNENIQASAKDQTRENETGEGGSGTKADEYASESELDDEALANLLSQGQTTYPVEGIVASSSSSSDSDESDADPFRTTDADDLDMYMDWERPSLLAQSKRRKKKSALGRINYTGSDPEIEQRLQLAWNSDRLKKAERKKQREELRALGQLGKKTTSPGDLRVKYPDGMTIDQITEELKAFLLDSEPTLTFPPMDTHGRKVLHELANKFNVKSKSIGKSDQRRTTLYRTNRTLPFTEPKFYQTVGRIHRKYFPRLDTKGKRAPQTQASRSGHAAASYHEGEVVGAAAPELGSENRGRAMLEKMGWSSGTALGAMHNKGILQPVAQTMKKGKAGLG